jgi:hypothetical protein
MKKNYVYFQSGDFEKIQQYKNQFNSGEEVKFEPQDLHTVTGLVKVLAFLKRQFQFVFHVFEIHFFFVQSFSKKFLLDLPESLFTNNLEHQFEAIPSK